MRTLKIWGGGFPNPVGTQRRQALLQRRIRRHDFQSIVFISAATTGIVGLPPADARADNSDSQAVDSNNWFFRTNSGWKSDNRAYVGANDPAPAGNWTLQYKHWFNAAAEPAAFVAGGAIAKPAKANWNSNSAAYFNNDVPVKTAGPLNPASTYGSSEGYVSPYFSNLLGYYSNIQTRSKALASSKDTKASSKTQVFDPATVSSPALNPNWDQTDFPLDPSGHWTAGLSMDEFGSVNSANPANAISDDYSLVLNKTGVSPTTYNLLSISITTTGVAVTTDLNGNNAAVSNALTSGLNGVLIMDGSIVSTTQIKSALSSYYSGGSWNGDPAGYDITTFQPDNLTELANVFHLDAMVFLDSSVTSASLSATAESDAYSEAVPEPSFLGLLSLSLVGLTRRGTRNKVLSRRGKSSIGKYHCPAALSGSRPRAGRRGLYGGTGKVPLLAAINIAGVAIVRPARKPPNRTKRLHSAGARRASLAAQT